MVMAAATVSLYGSVENALRIITPANVGDPLEFWLAFLLILSILNTVLKRVSFFSEKENNSARAIAALIISYFAVTAAWVSPVLLYMSSTLAVTAIILVSLLIVAAMAGYEIKGKAALALFIVAIIILLFSGLFSYAVVPSSAGSGLSGAGSEIGSVLSTFFNNPANVGWVIVLVFFLIIIPVGVFGMGRRGNNNS